MKNLLPTNFSSNNGSFNSFIIIVLINRADISSFARVSFWFRKSNPNSNNQFEGQEYSLSNYFEDKPNGPNKSIINTVILSFHGEPHYAF